MDMPEDFGKKEVCPNNFLPPKPGLYLQDEKNRRQLFGLPPGRWLEDAVLKPRT
jgi:hypothetical protein